MDKVVVKALGHKWNKGYTVDKKATYTAKGSKSIHCSRCNAKTKVTSIPMLKLSKVSSFKVKAGKKYAVVSFGKVKGATKYELYRSTKKGSGYKKVATLKSTKYTNKKLKSKKTYYYKVRAVAGSNKGSFSKVLKVKVK